jgi:hypothetical protein
VLAELTDPAFLRAWADGLGARVDQLEVTGTAADPERRTVLRLGVPTRGIPRVFTRFVGPEVTVADTRVWRTGTGDGTVADVDIRAEIFGRTAQVRGRRVLTAESGCTRVRTTAEVQVDAPLVGRRAEAAVAGLLRVVLRREDELLRRRLA